MKKVILLICMFLSGCAASFTPYPTFTKQEIAAAFQQEDAKVMALAEAIAKLTPAPKEAKK